MTYEKEWVTWHEARGLPSRNFICSYCGNPIASNIGFRSIRKQDKRQLIVESIYICHFCLKPTYFDKDGNQIPGASFGESIKGIPSTNVEDLYNEARDCISCNAYTASVLCSRKLLMNIAVSEGADEGKSFKEYVEFLSNRGFVPPKGKGLLDHIRITGNEATHKIDIMQREDAEKLIIFISMILKFNYEFMEMIKGKEETKQEEDNEK